MDVGCLLVPHEGLLLSLRNSLSILVDETMRRLVWPVVQVVEGSVPLFKSVAGLVLLHPPDTQSELKRFFLFL